jgi:hypothetical protein
VTPPTPQRCANEQGFSLHAAVRLAINQRHKLEHLCRYITQPAIANERLQRHHNGQVVLQLKSPYHDGTTHIVVEPLEFMQRLAALVPRPRLHLIRFHGVLAPNAKLRSEIIPSSGRQAGNVPVAGFPGAPDANDKLADHGDAPHHSAPARISWARLLKRVFDIDIERCPHCGGAFNDHHRHLRAYRDRQNPCPPRLAYPRTAACTGATLRAPRNRLFANRYPIPRGSAP